MTKIYDKIGKSNTLSSPESSPFWDMVFRSFIKWQVITIYLRCQHIFYLPSNIIYLYLYIVRLDKNDISIYGNIFFFNFQTEILKIMISTAVVSFSFADSNRGFHIGDACTDGCSSVLENSYCDNNTNTCQCLDSHPIEIETVTCVDRK